MKKVKELSEKNLSERTVWKKSKEKERRFLSFFFFPSSWFLGWKEKRKKYYKKKKKTKGMIFYFDKNYFSIPSLETKKQLETCYFTGYYL
jgi:hypothetical protein